jgi:hypothetical protein
VPKDCNPRRKKSGESDAQYRKRCGPRPLGQIKMGEKKNPRIPRKKGQPAGSKKHSDLYTDENPKGTIKGLKFATVKDAKASVSKIKGSGKSHAHKIQAAVAMEQRAREMGKTSQAAVYRAFINKMKKITKKKNENVAVNHDGKAAPYGSGYEKVEEKKWSQKYKKSIDCSNPKGFSQKAHCAGKKKKSESIMNISKEKLTEIILEEYCEVLSEKKDACYYKVKARYDVWPSAYASGALVKCRKVGAKNWGTKSKKKESIEEKRGTCWVGYQQKGMKEKGGKMVPNCVKEIYYEENGKGYGYTFEFSGEDLQEAEYQGRKVKLNKIMQGDKKKFKVYVKNDKGNVVVVHFGQDTIVIIQDQNTKLDIGRVEHGKIKRFINRKVSKRI